MDKNKNIFEKYKRFTHIVSQSLICNATLIFLVNIEKRIKKNIKIVKVLFLNLRLRQLGNSKLFQIKVNRKTNNCYFVDFWKKP